MALTPLINGHRYSYSSIEIMIPQAGGLFTDVKGISYSEELETAFIRGTSRAPLGWTAGNYNPGEAVLQMGKSTFTQACMTIGPGWLGINLLALVSFADIGEIVTVDTLYARITKAEDSHDYSAEGLYTNVTLQTIQILRNGIPPLLNRVF